MSVSSTLPLNVAETGPIFILTTAVKPLSPIFSNDWQPGIADLSTSGSFNSAHTFGLSAGKVTSPVIVMAMNVSLADKTWPISGVFEISDDVLAAFRNARGISRRPPRFHSYNDNAEFQQDCYSKQRPGALPDIFSRILRKTRRRLEAPLAV